MICKNKKTKVFYFYFGFSNSSKLGKILINIFLITLNCFSLQFCKSFEEYNENNVDGKKNVYSSYIEIILIVFSPIRYKKPLVITLVGRK